MKPPRLLSWLAGWIALVALADARAKTWRVSVAATPVERLDGVAAFALPAGAPRRTVLRDAAGGSVPLQIDADGTARFIVAQQKAGEALAFTLDEGAPASEAGVIVARDHGDLRIGVGGAPVLVYRMDKDTLPRGDIEAKFKRAGYLHPVFSPAGEIVTGDYPSNHVHHHAIWTAWSKTEFQGRAPNFWEMGEQTGTVEFVALDRTWSGPVDGGFVARQRMVDLSAPSPVTALDETWTLTVYNVPTGPVSVHVFDLTITQTCATPDPVTLPKYHYGGLGFRGPDDWEGKTGLAVLTSEGETDREKANGTRVRWCYLGGAGGDGRNAGIAILGHPENFRAPQPIRVHPDMPFFCFAPAQPDGFAIMPGRPLVLRYRFIVTDAPPGRDFLEAAWRGYASPAAVTIDSP